jgi:predicted acyl esterase
VEARRGVLCYTTPPLERDLEVTGPLSVTLYAASSAPDTDWTAKLVDVHPDGYARNLHQGIIRAGHRIRVEVSSSNFPLFDRNTNTGLPQATADRVATARQTVFHDRLRPSYALLPVISKQ